MTEQEWLSGRDILKMVEFITTKASERKLRLFCVACCGRIWNELVDPRSREAALIIAHYAEGKATREELHEAWRMATAAGVGEGPRAIDLDSHQYWFEEYGLRSELEELGPARLVADAARCSAPHAVLAAASAHFPGWQRYTLCVLYDLFANPFRPVKIPPDCLEPGLIRDAQTIYEEGLWDVMPALREALERAGCCEVQVLQHCRGKANHGRGCWVVDLILGKET